MYCSINRWAYFREKSTLCNNFIQKGGVSLCSRVGLFFGEITVILSQKDSLFRILTNINCCRFRGLVSHDLAWLLLISFSQFSLVERVRISWNLAKVSKQCSLSSAPLSAVTESTSEEQPAFKVICDHTSYLIY